MQATRYSCPCCGASLVFGSSSQQLDCPACGNIYPLETMQQVEECTLEDTTDAEMEWQTGGNNELNEEEHRQLRAYHCQSCGAEILADAETAATECVYCGNPTIMPDVLTGVYRPDGVIPFQKSREEAQEAFKNYCKGKKLLPDGFYDEERLEKITGVYVPFWLFSCDAEADMTFNATRVHSSRQGQYQVTRTDHFLLLRGGHVLFNQVPVDGSVKMDDAMMESIEPFNPENAKDFTIAYLSGYQAQRHDVGAEESKPRANARIRQSVDQLMRGTVSGYATAMPAKTRIDLRHGKVRQVLMPVWLLNTKWKDQIYTFAMNGQTGLFVGNLPTDKGKFVKWLVLLFAGIGAVGSGILYLLLNGGAV